MEIKGTLVAIGGKEDKGEQKEDTQKKDFLRDGILARVLELCPADHPKIAFITAASDMPEELVEDYKPAFEKLGNNEFHHINIRERKDIDDPAHLEYLKICDLVFFSGGDQVKLTEILCNSEFCKVLIDRYIETELIIAGTSAGAMAMTKHIIAKGEADKSHLKSEVEISDGIGFIESVLIDTHFPERGRINRLAQAVLIENKIIGIGIGEDTAVIISRGEKIKVIGSGVIMIVDGRSIRYNNMEEVKAGQPLSIENITLHMLSEFHEYDLNQRAFKGIE
jgi:cyanophycinase